MVLRNSQTPDERLDHESEIIEEVAGFEFDPLGYVLYTFDWGYGPLEGEDGPDEWQADLLFDIGRAMREGDVAKMFAIVSGHGIGKTTLIAWIIHWFMATRPNCAGVATANTKSQLTDKLWRELAKWNSRAINAHWFDWTAEKFMAATERETWFIAARPWTKERSEAFAGLHEKDVLVVFDEASAIDNIIWEVVEGAMTEPGALWLVTGNPTRNSGRFRECFGRDSRRWNTRQIDSRTVRRTNKEQLKQWGEYYGEDSDFFRVRVRGLFPVAGSMQLIPSDLVEAARAREVIDQPEEPLVLGVDVARFGDDDSVIIARRGRDARTHPRKRLLGHDTMQVAGEAARMANALGASAIFVDGGGVGGGVVDRLRMLRLPPGCEVFDVQFGGEADAAWQMPGSDGQIKFANKVAEMWWQMRAWLKGGCLPDDQRMEDDLVGREYGYTGYTGKDGGQQIILEKKDDMKKRGLKSPDDADALALTFAYPVSLVEFSDMDTGNLGVA